MGKIVFQLRPVERPDFVVEFYEMANDIKPYVYWVKDKNTGQKYTGIRWHNVKLKLSPSEDLGKRYFTSSTIIKEKFKKNPKSFIYKILRTFKSQDEAIDFETKLNKKNINKKRYLNRSVWPQQKYDDARIKKQSEAMIKRYKDPEERRKTSLKAKGKKIAVALFGINYHLFGGDIISSAEARHNTNNTACGEGSMHVTIDN